MRVLELAREMGLLKLGTVALDGTKIHANASRHSALSYEHVLAIRTATEGRQGAPLLEHCRKQTLYRWSCGAAPGSLSGRDQ